MPDERGRMKVLHVVMGWDDGRGGVKQFILNAANALSSKAYRQIVLPVGPITGEALELDLRDSIVGSSNPLMLLMAARKLRCALEEFAPDVVHVHCNNGLGLLYAGAARSAGVPVRIVHSHSSSLGDDGMAKRVVNSALVRAFASAPTRRIACSDIAGRHLFGRVFYELVRNGIDVSRFAFSKLVRAEVRSELGIAPDAVVLGHIGSGVPVKNTAFVIDIMERLTEESDAHALLIGSGDEIPMLRDRAKETGLSERVHFLGVVSDAWRYYSAMDVFLLPSFYEGLPISLIEAQANGLPCIAADAVSREADVTELITFLELAGGVGAWVEHALDMASRGRMRTEVCSVACGEAVARAGFSLETLGERLDELYQSDSFLRGIE